MLLEQLPRAQKIQPGAETGFANNQMAVSGQGGETLCKGVLFDKDIAGFFKPRLVRKIHVIKHP